MLKPTLIAASVLATLSGCSSLQNSQQVVDLLADNLDIHYQVVTNHGANDGLACESLGAEWASCNQVIMTLETKVKRLMVKIGRSTFTVFA
ncbi:beta-hexosaminidase [Vibrio ponticus]|nr:beta-hexosaminidase [Vibrio ponticus]